MHPERFDSLVAEAGQLPRRAVLGRAAAGLGLAITGLVTSAGLDAAAAGGKNKGKKRRARKRRKNNNNGNPGPGAPGGAYRYPGRNVRLIVENLTPNAIDFRGVVVNESRQCISKTLQSIAANTAPTFAPGAAYILGVVYDQWGRQYVFTGTDQDPDDGFPYVEFHHGGTLLKEACLVESVTDEPYREMGIGMSFEQKIVNFRFVVEREEDINNELVFRFKVNAI